MNNNFLLKSIAFLFLIALVCLLLPWLGLPSNMANGIFSLSISVGQILSVMLLLKNGSFLNSSRFKVILVFLVFIMIAVLFKMLHLKFADLLIIFSSCGLALVYIVYFFTKKPKDLLSVLKVIWAITSFIGGALVVLRLIPEYYLWVATILLWLAVFVFYLEDRKKITEK